MISQKFLDSLKGQSVNTALEMVMAVGHIPYLVAEGYGAITMLAKPNTVVLWQENGKISVAEAGDGLELGD